MPGDRLSSQAYRALYVHCPYGVLFTNPNGDVLAANPAACELLRFSETEICALGRPGLADHSDERWEQLLAERARTGRGSGIARMLRGDGTVVEVEMSARIFSDTDGTPRTCTIIRDVTERVHLEAELLRLNERLSELAVTDELTGLHNRRGLLAAGGQVLDLAARQGLAVSIVFLDVDKLKRLNDGLGHPAGDAALRVVADALRHTLRRPDAIARIGGDEFVAVALDLGEAECAAIAQRIQEQLSLPAAVATVGQPVEVSIGWTTLQPGDSSTVEALMGRADRAMYQTKLAKNRRSPTTPSG
jgi:diguanylate cyclase (GGDEF)-like protein/PAS domain S-box-containing protein